MSISDAFKAVIVGVPLVNEVTDDTVITALQLDNMAWLGVTFGAWMKILLAVALVLLLVERVTTIRKNWRDARSNETSGS